MQGQNVQRQNVQRQNVQAENGRGRTSNQVQTRIWTKNGGNVPTQNVPSPERKKSSGKTGKELLNTQALLRGLGEDE